MSIWTKNVGTPENPVSYLHEYAVALIWDRLSAGGCFVWTASNEYEHISVPEGGRVDIPDELTSIAGMVPDIAIYDSNHRPVTLVEVQVTSRPSADKMTRVNRLGLRMVVILVPNQEALLTMFRPVSAEELISGFNIPSSYYGHTNLVNKQLDEMGVSSMADRSRRSRAKQELKEANTTVANLIQSLKMCDPTLRQELRSVLDELDSIESLYPIIPLNPKLSTLEQKEKPDRELA